MEAASAFAAAEGLLGRAGILVNVAGAFIYAPLHSDPSVRDTMFRASLKACANMRRAAAGRLQDGGGFINIGAARVAPGGAGIGPYSSSKGGVAQLTESLASELGGRIGVNAVLPWMADNPRNRRNTPSADWSRWTEPQAVADVITFLASPLSRAINGALTPVTAATGKESVR